jgi:hypothetical protein
MPRFLLDLKEAFAFLRDPSIPRSGGGGKAVLGQRDDAHTPRSRAASNGLKSLSHHLASHWRHPAQVCHPTHLSYSNTSRNT